MNQVRQALEILHDLERSYLPTDETRKIPEWWTVSGYRQILQEALARIESHERRAIKIYGDRAVRFGEALARKASA